MMERLKQRLQELKAEFEAGQKQLAELDARKTNLRDTLLRISGAMQVLEEELGKFNGENGRVIEPSDTKSKRVKEPKAQKSEK